MARKRAHRRAVLPMAVDRFAVGETGCDCTCGGSISVTIAPRGCVNPVINQALFAGITVNIYTDSGMGTLLASGVTAANGKAILSWSGSNGTYWLNIPAPNLRWTVFGASVAMINGGTYVAPLPTNTAGSYVCCMVANLDIPLHSPLHYTDPNGTQNLTWTATCNQQNFGYGSPGIHPIFSSCNTTTGATRISPQIFLAGPNTLSVNRTWYASAGTPLCYCDTSTLCSSNYQALEVSQTYTIASIAVPLSFSVNLTLTSNPLGYAADPMITLGQSTSVTVSE